MALAWGIHASPGTCSSLWSSDLALYLEDYLMHEHYYLGYESVLPKVLPQNEYRSLWPIFYGPVILHYILKTICCMNIYFGIKGQYDLTFDLKII